MGCKNCSKQEEEQNIMTEESTTPISAPNHNSKLILKQLRKEEKILRKRQCPNSLTLINREERELAQTNSEHLEFKNLEVWKAKKGEKGNKELKRLSIVPPINLALLNADANKTRNRQSKSFLNLFEEKKENVATSPERNKSDTSLVCPTTPQTAGIYYPIKFVERDRKLFFSYGMERKVRHLTESQTLELPLSSTPQSSKRLRIDVSDFRIAKKGSVLKNYRILDTIGKGAYGEVRKVQHMRTAQIRVLKIISQKKFAKEIVPGNEFDILKKLDHPNIVKIFEYYQDSRNYHLIMEYCAGGELFSQIMKSRQFTERQAANTIFQVLSAVAYCHERNIVHRDIKPQNLLLEKDSIDSTVKVIDFGASKMNEEQEIMKKPFGTAHYIAPEVIKGEYNQKCDVWSIGIILYLLLCGKAPFTGNSTDEIFSNVLKGQYSMNGVEWKNVSQIAKNFVNKLLIYNPSERVTSLQALSDIWIVTNTSNLGEIIMETALLTFNNLSKFGAEQKLQEVVINLMVAQMQDKEEEAKLLETFQAFDTNKDGQLSREELEEGYTQLFGNIQIAKIEVERIIQQVDVNQNGLIDYSEFLVANANLKKLFSEEKLRVAFNELDLDGNGKITIDELKEYFKNIEVDEDYWEEAVAEVDINGDGEIDFDEFCLMMEGMLSQSPSFIEAERKYPFGVFKAQSQDKLPEIKLDMNNINSSIEEKLNFNSLRLIKHPQELFKEKRNSRVQGQTKKDSLFKIAYANLIPEDKSASPPSKKPS